MLSRAGRLLGAFLVVSAFLAAAACSSDSSEAESTDEVIEGKFDVGGHKLYLRCVGTGKPTIVYVHGSIVESSVDPHANGAGIQARLRDDYRVCVYDRRNLAHSDTVDAAQSPDDAIGDLHDLLAAAGVKPPLVLLGASFGGLLSYLYANLHREDVVGMVLLDSPFPDELSLEHLVPPDDRYAAFDKEDEDPATSLERISHFKALTGASRYIGKEPSIPVTYLASLQEPMNTLGVPAYDKAILGLQAAYVKRFSPGKLVRVDSPHFMEPAVPEKIAAALRDVINSAGY